MRHTLFCSLALTLLPLSTVFAQDKSKPKIPDIPAEFADADAVILRWEQSWKTDGRDGEIVYHERKDTLIRNDRTLGDFADPRIEFNNDYEAVEILVARTVCPDGRIVEVPEYARNLVSPGGLSGWPAFAAIRQLVVTFGGIEPGSVLEFEWKRTTRPPLSDSLVVDERIDQPYPILQRQWTIDDKLPIVRTRVVATREEPGFPGREETEHFVYTSHRTRAEWIASLLGPIEKAARATDFVTALAKKWSEGKSDPLETAREIQKKLQERISIIHVPAVRMPAQYRDAETVIKTRYGSAVEVTSALLALCRAAGLEADLFFTTDPYGAIVPQNEVTDNPTVAEYGIALAVGKDTTYWHAGQGRIRDPGPWGGRLIHDRALAAAGPEAKPKVFRFAGEPDGSGIDIDIRLTLDSKTAWTGEVDLKATGLFVDPDTLWTQDGKNSAVQAMVDRVLPNARMDSFTVTTLSDDTFAVTGKLTSTAELTDVHGDRMLTLPQDGPWTTKVSLPLGRSERKTPVRIAGPFRQTVNLDIRLPDEWQMTAVPPSIAARSGEWGDASLTVAEKGHRIQWTQSIEIKNRVIAAKAFMDLRSAITGLQAERARAFVFRATGKQS